MKIRSKPQILADDELRKHCVSIVAEGKELDEWNEIESCGMFQSENYCGGFDAVEREFLFSYYDKNGKEWWIGVTLEASRLISAGQEYYLDLLEAE